MKKHQKRWHRGLLVILIALCALPSGGCWDAQPIEEQGIVVVVGTDINQQHPDLVDLTFGIPLFEESRQAAARITTTSGRNYEEASDLWRSGTALNLAAGKVRLMVFGEEIAKAGVPAFLNYVQVPTSDNNALVAVSRGRAEDLLRGSLTETERIGTNTANLLRASHDEGLTFLTEVNDLITLWLATGIDPILPLLDLTIGEDIVFIAGSALFSDLNMVGEIDPKETRLLLALQGRAKAINYTPELGMTEELQYPEPSVRLIDPKARLASELIDGRLKATIDFRSDYVLRNYYTNADLTKTEVAEQVTQDLESELTLAFQEVLAKLQHLRVDPLGIGKKYRVKNHKDYDDDVFRELWADAEVEVKVDLRFKRTGAMIKTG